MAKVIYSVPKPLAGQYLEPETDVRLHPCGPSFCVRFKSDSWMPRSLHRKQRYLGDFRRGWEGVLRYGSLGEERQSFGMAPDRNVQTESSTTPGRGAGSAEGGCQSVTLRHMVPLTQCRGEGKHSSSHCAWSQIPCSRPSQCSLHQTVF